MKKAFLLQVIITITVGWTNSLLAQSTVERETLVYSVKDDKELLLDKYVDNGAAYEGKRPVMIYVHGGGFATGSRVNALQIKYNKHFAAQGFVSISINYRLGLEGVAQPTPEIIDNSVKMAVEDLLDATNFILENAEEWNIDKEKIIISGGSAGAITCLTAEYEICSNGEAAKVLPADFNYAGVISQAGCVIVPGDSLEWETAPCPILLMHGDKDQLVPFEKNIIGNSIYAGSSYLHSQFSEAKFPHWLYVEKGADHIVALKPLKYNFGEIDTFIEKFVMGGSESIVETIWEEKTPGSMDKMFDIVPLYMIGWGKTDEEVENDK